MKYSIAALAAIVCLLAVAVPSANAALTSDTDLWDATHGCVVDDDSGCSGVWPATYMFQDRDAAAHFADNLPAGTVHWVEWHTPAPVTIESINLVAYHAGDPRDMRFGGFDPFRLFCRDATDNWVLVDELTDIGVPHPLGWYPGSLYFGGGPNYTASHQLEYSTAVPATTAQYWRAEFVQYGPPSIRDSGPMVMELDGYGSCVPEPAAICLVAAAGLLALRRRR